MLMWGDQVERLNDRTPYLDFVIRNSRAHVKGKLKAIVKDYDIMGNQKYNE